MAVVQGLHLLKLVGREDGGELLLEVLMEGVHLLFLFVRAERGVAPQRAHFLVTIGQNRFEFGCLVR